MQQRLSRLRGAAASRMDLKWCMGDMHIASAVEDGVSVAHDISRHDTPRPAAGSFHGGLGLHPQAMLPTYGIVMISQGQRVQLA